MCCPTFTEGRAIIGVCGAPFKCPPAPSEAALLLHDYLTARGVRGDCEISFVIPFGSPVPPSPDTSAALRRRLRGARHHVRPGPSRQLARPGAPRRRARRRQRDAYDLFLGVPKHRAPDVVVASGMAEDGYVPVNSATLETRFPGVYALGDVAHGRRPEGRGVRRGRGPYRRRVADRATDAAARRRGLRRARLVLRRVRRRPGRPRRRGLPLRSQADGDLPEPSAALVAEKEHFGSSRRARWFGR